MRLSRIERTAFLFASLLCVAGLVASIRGQSTRSAADQNVIPSSPNIAALRAAENGLLHKPAFVEFFSNDCAICRRIQGTMRMLDLQFAGRIKFIYVDIDLPESQAFVLRYNVRGIPTFTLIDQVGRTVQSIPGWPGDVAVTAALEELVHSD